MQKFVSDFLLVILLLFGQKYFLRRMLGIVHKKRETRLTKARIAIWPENSANCPRDICFPIPPKCQLEIWYRGKSDQGAGWARLNNERQTRELDKFPASRIESCFRAAGDRERLIYPASHVWVYTHANAPIAKNLSWRPLLSSILKMIISVLWQCNRSHAQAWTGSLLGVTYDSQIAIEPKVSARSKPWAIFPKKCHARFPEFETGGFFSQRRTWLLNFG